MPKDTTEWRVSRHKLLDQCREIVSKADGETRDRTAEERATYDKLWTDATALKTKIEDQEQRNALEVEQEAERLSQEEEKRKKAKDKPTETRAGFNPVRASAEYRDAFSSYLVRGPEGMTVEQRALTAGEATKGGYLYASEQFVNDLIQNVTDATPMRGMCRTISIGSADTISCPVIANRMAAAAWTSELGTPSTDSTLTFGKRSWTPHPLAKEILVSNELLRKVGEAESIVRGELARIVAEANENGFLTGTGVQQPLGVFTASADGVTTARDVSTSNSATAPTFDGLKIAKYTLKQQYWPNAKWIADREFAQVVALIKDGNGRYIWQDSVVTGEPDRLLGFPVVLSEFAPDTFTSAQYVAVLGDFSNYWIVDAMDMQIARANELYIRTNQTWFGVRMATDGGPAKSEAFVRVKLGT